MRDLNQFTKIFSLAFILIFINTFSSLGQEIEDSCPEALSQAEKDFKNGKIEATSYGLIIAADWDFEDFYDQYLFEKYNIKSSSGGCIVTEYNECYSSKMFELIKEKFGEDFFERTRKEAATVYPYQIKTFDEDTAQDENSDFYVIVDVQPEFPGGLDSLFKFVEKEQSKFQFPEATEQGRSFIVFVIDSTGHPYNIEVLKGSNPQIDTTLVKILTKMPDWEPGIFMGRKVNVKMVLPFKY